MDIEKFIKKNISDLNYEIDEASTEFGFNSIVLKIDNEAEDAPKAIMFVYNDENDTISVNQYSSPYEYIDYDENQDNVTFLTGETYSIVEFEQELPENIQFLIEDTYKKQLEDTLSMEF